MQGFVEPQARTCCICGAWIAPREGCNPDPVNTLEDAWCCRECNETVIMPARRYIDRLVADRKKVVAHDPRRAAR